ncbi:inositol monophosphatase family protein [Nocardia seriolae]|uniref:inositol-phosphate phosphatase n=1 Tax=Nocardia seriolae TaxID=37332 RepID=A0ABC8B0Z7_9NOCA|nr:inositol monophosphatase family protein [Nocardia seriolae]APA99911.1 Inositol-phosphate phosphatase [Nocardia seriolae]OJF79670.1 inositol monophosphatase [Nocardia seriolae]PSK30016.1 inositol monophosphatase [Nocardia seriolae]QOW36400.1 inositol monophosphatase [Nocardia seriolae]QUN16085.1 inositol monophosphatase [Nocardia seriolae]
MELVPESNFTPTVPATANPDNSDIAELRSDIAELRRVAVYLAETAAAHVRARRPEVFGPHARAADVVQSKSTPTDPVTIVDTETEQLVRKLVADLRPGEPVVGEEDGGSLADDPNLVHWIVDPIDGTVNFLYGIPSYSVSVAALRGGRPVAGAVADVAHAVTFSAGLGQGAHRADSSPGGAAPGGTPIALRANPVEEVSMALVATGFAYATERRTRQGELVAQVLPHIRDIRRFGSAALDLCAVAEGRTDAYYEHGLNLWDWAAGALIAAEAGARLILPPAPDSPGAAGDLVSAAAPGIADELFGLFKRLDVTAPIPVP